MAAFNSCSQVVASLREFGYYGYNRKCGEYGSTHRCGEYGRRTAPLTGADSALKAPV